ncbi:MAG: FG-GAP-like repeat-containing protein [Spirulina sp.]
MSQSMHDTTNFITLADINSSSSSSQPAFVTTELIGILDQVQQHLQQAASDPILFFQVLGHKSYESEILAIQASWTNGDFSIFPKIQLLPDQTMGDALGAYASPNETIYLSQSLVAAEGASVDPLTGGVQVLIEEVFHWLDDQTGTDTLGDEGELARTLIFGSVLSVENYQRILSEDDSGILEVQGELLSVEFSIKPQNDFDGDGKSDILWRHNNGQVATWLINGSALKDGALISSPVGSEWQIKGSGDFDGDGKTDAVWQHSNGQVVVWLMNGLSLKTGAAVHTPLGSEWKLEGTGDFDGDGKADILWRHNNGQVVNWLMDGANIKGGGNIHSPVGSEWQIKGIGDFNGDGKSDILWQHNNSQVVNWLMNGTTIQGGGNIHSPVGSEWTIQDTGDFDGDSKSDILWRHNNGQVVNWLIDGTTIKGGGNIYTPIGSEWQIQSTGDFDGDGKSDILWRSNNGQVVNWLIDGATIKVGGNIQTPVSHDWQVQSLSQNSHGLLRKSNQDILLGNKTDFNGDGKTDFLRQEKGGFATDAPRMLETFLSNGDGTFRLAWSNQDANRAMHGDLTNLYMGDFNGDGRTDFLRQEKGAFATDPWLMLEVYTANLDGSFTRAGVMDDPAMHGDLTNLFIGDFNGDGRSDFLRQEKGGFATDAPRMLETYLSNGDGTFRLVWGNQDANRAMHGDLTNLYMGDFNGDGRTDFMRQEKGAFASDIWSMIEVYTANLDGSFTRAGVMHDAAMHGDLTNLFIGDFNGDGRSDFLRQEKGSFATDAPRMLETYLSNGDGTFRLSWANQDANRMMHGDLTNLYMGDFNGDGRTDFLRQEKGAFATDPWLMLDIYVANPDGSFSQKFVMNDSAMNGDYTNLFLGDFDGNGRSDLLLQEKGPWANADNSRMLASYLSNADGSLTQKAKYDDYAMHGDLTNLFTDNIKRNPVLPTLPPSEYYPELKSLTDSDWNYQSRDNLFFDGNTSNGESLGSVKQIYSDLSHTIFDSYKAMTAGYRDTTNYSGTHYGIDMGSFAGNTVKAAIGGVATLVQNITGNYFVGIRSDDGNLWIYGHLENYTSGIIGQRVEAGRVLGTVFDGARLSDGTWMNQHTHLEVHRGHSYIRANAMSPLQAYWQWRNRKS